MRARYVLLLAATSAVALILGFSFSVTTNKYSSQEDTEGAHVTLKPILRTYPGDLLSPPDHDTRFRVFLANFWDFTMQRKVEIPAGHTYHFVALRKLLEVLSIREPVSFAGVGGPDVATKDVFERAVAGVDFDLEYTTSRASAVWRIGGSLTPKEMIKVMRERKLAPDFDVIKLDFDGWECHLMEELFAGGFRPKVVIIELTPVYVPPLKFAMYYCPNYKVYDGLPLFYGCSLQYAYDLMRTHGYSLVQYAALDGYFVHSEMLRKTALAPMQRLSAREHYKLGNPMYWGTIKGEQLSRGPVNFLEEWFNMQDSAELKRRVMGNLTALHRPLMERCPYKFTVTGVDDKVVNRLAAPDALQKAPAVAPSAAMIHCIGGTVPAQWTDRVCHLKWVCLARNNTFRFYSTKGFVDFVGARVTSLEGIPIANLRPQPEPDAPHIKTPFYLELINGTIPASAAVFDKPVALFDPFWPLNWGHAIGDDLLPVFRALSIFGLLRDDGNVQLLATSLCQEQYRKAEEAAICARNYDTILGSISKHPIWSLRSNGFFSGDTQEVCFQHLTVGSGLGTFRINNPQLMKQFRRRILASFGVNSKQHVQAPASLCLMQKIGKRAIFNMADLEKGIGERFPGTRVLKNQHLLSLKEQVLGLQSCAVLVTPSGTIGMTGLFLPVGSVLIAVDYFDTREGRSWPMDGMFFKQMPWLRELHFPFSKHEVDLSEAPAGTDEWRKYRDYGKVIVNITRMIDLVDDAFDWVKRYED